jgi:HEAT repeat protein
VERNRWRILVSGVLCATAALAADARASDEPSADLVQVVLQLLADQDKEVRGLALEQVRSAGGGEATTKLFAAELDHLPPESQAVLLGALADRGDATALAVVRRQFSDATEETVRVAAVEALGSLGDADDVPRLAPILTEGSAALQRAAKKSLTRMGGASAIAALTTAMDHAPPATRTALIEILASRGATSAASSLLSAAVDDDAAVRTAAMAALAKLAAPEHLPGMTAGFFKAQDGAERLAAERALAAACLRTSGDGDRAEPLLAEYETLDDTQRLLLLPVLGRVGGDEAKAVVESAIADLRPAQHEAGLRALGNWPDASVSERLIELAADDPHPAHRIQALRALIRVATLEDGRSDDDRLKALKRAANLAQRHDERTLAIERARAIRSIESLRFAVGWLDETALAQKACETIVELAHHRSLREPNKAEFDAALDKVLKVGRDPIVRDRAVRYKKGQTWARPTAAVAP